MEENNSKRNDTVKAKSLGISEGDLIQINTSGIDIAKIDRELSLFRSGINKAFLEKPAAINDGIVMLSNEKRITTR
jgi:hypothetical protein